jgi:hypothetical protein
MELYIEINDISIAKTQQALHLPCTAILVVSF